MKLLSDLLYKVRIEEVVGTTNTAITAVNYDSRKVVASSLFVAVSGVSVDGHKFVDKAIELGAIAIVCEVLPEQQKDGVTYVKVKNSREALAWIGANLYDNPSNEIKLVGVTGTNGKTTSVTLLYNLFKGLGYKVGLLSTVVNKINNKVFESTHTTGDPLAINELLRKMVEEGCGYCFMEVSSHALHQHRVTGLEFDVAVFTNITHDHLDYHETFDEYIKAKKIFFDQLSNEAFALINKDQRHGETMVLNTSGKVKTYGLKSMADFKCKILENGLTGLLLSVDGAEVWTKLIGEFNAYNLLSVYAVAVLLGEDKMQVLTSLSTLTSVEGRFQYVKGGNNVIGIVDYAHTPDALKNVLNTISKIKGGNERIITLVGCGGDRDKTKRPVMAKIACEFSDKVILTSDNPRSEDPQQIIEDMKEGVGAENFRKTLSIVDRMEAIRTGCALAEEGDVVLVAGKGHEKYQEINGVKHDFDDMKILKETLNISE